MSDTSSSETGPQNSAEKESNEDNAKKAEEFKGQANEYFKAQNFEDAIEYYSKAIALNPTVAAYFGNRSFAYLKTECFGSALADASKALELDRAYIKGYYRRATANLALGKFKVALKDYETVKKYRPNDKDAKAKYTECHKIVTQQAFERAIRVDEAKKNLADSLDIANMVIDDKYSGPKLEDGKVTKEFAEELLEYFHKEQKLERKYVYQVCGFQDYV
ncbi:Serine/threonine-protein phosphatase 5 [Holothuria leucospilota]|uniref:Serine/threonine-protein phosphatase 5 n=1 Tax=Holothuria leucospilota TaxID=206669 RepID=A0A9Q1HH69_HOLLE|nr:Serine/threonine-protein phosphatase 5 [Holothuria leucospilota]